ncbi:MAG: cobalamin-dependent protein [Deltaproteobacteria bacterium]|nr:cobalamin-dependent protein [Deltaproteobacteria bacterium]
MAPLKILFVRAPRKFWVYVNEDDNFWMPLNFPCLSAVLKQHLTAGEVEIQAIDCCARKIGWTTLARMMRDIRPDVVGFGDETCYSEEGLHVARLAREINPDCVVVAGGSHFPYVAEQTLPNSEIDISVLGEGEFTFLELIQEILSGSPDYSKVKGIAYVSDGRVVINSPRPIIPDLDILPLPDFELMDFRHYGRGGVFWAFPGMVPFFHSRGCFSGCTFCAFWPTESEWRRNSLGDLVPTPTYRTKSVDKTIEQMEILYGKYDRRFFAWIDGTFNADQKWNEGWSEEILKRNWKIHWFAFQRADSLMRDEKAGVLEKLVRSGMAYTIVGVERHRDKDFELFHKIRYTRDMVSETCTMMSQRYPQVFLQGTFIIGLEDDSKQELLDLIDYAVSIGIDFPSFHFLTPAPGTRMYAEMKASDRLPQVDYSKMDWFTPLWPTKFLSKEELSRMMYLMMKRFMLRKPGYAKNLFTRHWFKRTVYWWFLRVAAKFFVSEVKHSLFGAERMLTLRKPSWYNS